MATTETIQDQDHGKKCYVLMLQSHFPSKHQRKGSRTLFEQLVQRGVKIHTFRDNFQELLRQSEVINSGAGYMSLRVWEGKPYHSPQREVKRLYRIGVQKAEADIIHDEFDLYIDDNNSTAPWAIASSGGLCYADLREWLCPNGKPWSGCIVHFTNHRY